MAKRPINLPTKRPLRSEDPVGSYAFDVCTGKTVACRNVRLACERHFRDLHYGGRRGLVFSRAWALHALKFFPGYLHHSKGEWGGQAFDLEPWQEFVVGSAFGWFRKDGTRRFRTVYIEIARKNGKSQLCAGIGLYGLVADKEPGAEVYAAAPLALDTEIPTADGWTTMGAVKTGDKLFDERGQLCAVTYVSPVLDDRECWELTFSDGTSVVCDAEHRWLTDALYLRGSATGSRRRPVLRRDDLRKAVFSLHNRTHYVCRWNDPDRDAKGEAAIDAAIAAEPLARSRVGVRTTAEIAASLREQSGHLNHRIAVAGALSCGSSELPIPPYTLGVWLGDGRSNRGSIVAPEEDAPETVALIEREGFKVVRHTPDTKLHYMTVLGLRTLLREQGLLDAKRVPPAYLRASAADRLALLRGLMDTDGTCTKAGECRFANVNPDLAQAVYELTCSLGIRAHLRLVIRQESERAKGWANYYLVSFKPGTDDLVPFGLSRKANRMRPEGRAETTKWRMISAARRVDPVPVRCISVDSPSSLYLITRAFIPTHNTRREQARIIFNEAQRMVRSSPELTRHVSAFKFNMSVDRTASKFEPLSSDDRTLDGLNPHFVLIDELHKHRSRAVLDVLNSALGARRSPMIWIITTAGDDNPESVYASENAHAIRVVERTVEDDSYLSFVCTLDLDDEWSDPRVWIKANPNLGISVKLDELKRLALKAKSSPPSLTSFRRLNLNVRTSDATRAINMDQWRRNTAGPFDPAEMHGRRFFGALDLSSKIDLSCWLKLFPPAEGETRWKVVPRFWLPADTVEEKSDRDRVQYQRWIDAGFIEVTPGNAIDHNEVEQAIREDCRLHEAASIAYDPWNAYQLASSLDTDGVPVVEFVQGLRSYSAPTKELMAWLAEEKLDHGGNPVLAWMAANLHTQVDKNLNVMPTKKHSIGRIDGMTSLIMAIGRVMLDEGPSVYETRGLLAL